MNDTMPRHDFPREIDLMYMLPDGSRTISRERAEREWLWYRRHVLPCPYKIPFRSLTRPQRTVDEGAAAEKSPDVHYPWIDMGVKFLRQADGSYKTEPYIERLYRDGRREPVNATQEA